MAVQYFQPLPARHHVSEEDEEELAEQLLAILNQKFSGPLDFVSRDPQGRLDDGLPADEEKISSNLESGYFPILLVRSEDEQGRKLWYFSRVTLESVPKIYDSLTFPDDREAVAALPGGTPSAVASALAVAGDPAFSSRFRSWWHADHESAGNDDALLARGAAPSDPSSEPWRRIGPLTFMIALLIHYALVAYIGTSLLYRLYYRRVIWIFLAIAFYWLLTRITRAISARIGASLSSRGMFAERSIVSLIRRFVEVSIFILVTLIVLHGLGFNVSAALAGVGIGTLALGLGAQKTFENMFGGVSILFDKVILIGDTCKVNNQSGVVEDIGLRSTRLRTPERTLLSIPNGTMATAVIENLRFRDKFLCQQVIRLRYDLSPDHVRFVLEEIRQLLLENPQSGGFLFACALHPFFGLLAGRRDLLLHLGERLQRLI